ncbi:MAG TPA: hypothetical protein ENI23_01090 [bacterium]|nr:hypothetical protein [bacterium]
MNLPLIGNITVNPFLVFVFVSFLVFLFTFWFLQRKEGSKDAVTFDVAAWGLFMGVLLSRLIGFFFNLTSYSDLFWSFNFLRDDLGNIDLFGSLPWAVFRIWDGNIYLPIIGFGLIIGVWLHARSRTDTTSIRKTIDNSVIALVISQIILVFGAFITDFYLGASKVGLISIIHTSDGLERIPIHVFEIIAMIVILVIGFRVKDKKKGLATGVYLSVFGATQFVLRYFTEGYDPIFLSLDFGHLIALLMILLSLIFALSALQEEKEGELKRIYLSDSKDGNRSIENEDRKKYSVSYSGSNGVKVKNSVIERLKASTRKIRRGVS